MKFFIWMIALGIVTIAPVRADEGMAALKRFVGTWSGQGVAVQTAMGPAGALSGQTTCRLSADGLFLLCEQTGRYGNITNRDITVFTYDSASRKYAFYRITATDANSSSLSYDGNGVFTYSNHFSQNGTSTYIRTLNIFTGPDRYTWRTEFSTEGGHWTLMNSGVVTRAR